MKVKATAPKVGFSITFHDGAVFEFPAEGAGPVEMTDEQAAELRSVVEVDAEGNPVPA